MQQTPMQHFPGPRVSRKDLETDTVVVGRTAWEMSQWEVHYLRNLLTRLLSELQACGRVAQRTQADYSAAQLQALGHPECRRTLDQGPNVSRQ